MLVLEIELLTGAYRASHIDRSASEWPPHPERVFSALAQAWGDGGRSLREREALEWLERLDPPEIEASPPEQAHDRDAPKVFVPPNDARGDSLAALPARRPRQERRFNARIPADPMIRLLWSTQPPPELLSSLSALAGRVASIGHSTSLTRCVVRETEQPSQPERSWQPDPRGSEALRVPYPGRLADLERWFSVDDAERRERPRTKWYAHYERPRAVPKRSVPHSVFGDIADWFVFEELGGFQPDVLAFGHVARRVRDALMQLGPQPAGEVISGHAPGGRPSSRPHIAIVPLANVGWPYSNGDVLGFALILPQALRVDERTEALKSIAALAHVERGAEAVTEVHLTRSNTWVLRRMASPSRASLRPERYCDEAASWASVTPLLLDRFPDKDDPAEEARIVAAACFNIGLPEPVEIELHQHSAVYCSPSAYPARGASYRPSWSFPAGSTLANRPRRHVLLRFAAPVRGPVILGAGRYHGFGLCLPVHTQGDR